MKFKTLILTSAIAWLGLINVPAQEQASLEQRLQTLLPKLSAEPESSRYGPRMALQDITSEVTVAGVDRQREQWERLLVQTAAKEDVPVIARAWLLRQLENCGGESVVDGLVSLLGSKHAQLAELARRALEQNGSEKAGAALIEVADKEKDPAKKAHYLNAVAQRRDTRAQPLLAGALKTDHAHLQKTALRGLARLGSPEAVALLMEHYDRQDAAGKLRTGRFLLAAARDLGAAGKTKQAFEICERLYQHGEPGFVRAGALRGIVAARPKKAGDLLVVALQSTDPEVRRAAITTCREVPENRILPTMLAVKLGRRDDPDRATILQVLRDLADPAVSPQVARLLHDDPDTKLRILAVETLANTGSTSAVEPLVKAASDSETSLARAARNALTRVDGKLVDAELIQLASRGEDADRITAVNALADRGSRKAVSHFLASVEDSQGKVRDAIYQALGRLSDHRDVKAVTALVLKDEGASEALGNIAGRVGNSGSLVREINSTISKTEDPAVRARFFPALAASGGSKALKQVGEGLKTEGSRAAAIDALASWKGFEAADQLVKLVGDEKLGLKQHVKCATAMGRLVRDNGVDLTRRKHAALTTFDSLRRDEERRALITALATIPHEGVAAKLMALLENENLRAEAAAAAVKLAENLGDKKTLAGKLAEAVIESGAEGDLRKRALKVKGK